MGIIDSKFFQITLNLPANISNLLIDMVCGGLRTQKQRLSITRQ